MPGVHLSDMTPATRSLVLSPAPTTSEIDQVVHGLIDLHFAGQIDAETTRREISAALYVAGIHLDVANKRFDLPRQLRSDLADLLLSRLIDKLITGSFYSFETGRQKSACGWARQVAKSVAQSELRNHQRAARRLGAPIDPTSHEFAAMVNGAAAQDVVDPYALRRHAAVAELVEDFTQRIRGMRSTDRVFVSAETLCVGLGVRPAVRPESMADRDYCLEVLSADQTLAQRSLRRWRQLVFGSALEPMEEIDERVLALWDEQTEDSSAELLGRPGHVCHLLALAAASPLPRPPRKALQRLKTVVMTASGLQDDWWCELASRLVDAYVASQYEAYSEYATMTDEARRAAAAAHRRDRSRLGVLLEWAAAHPDAPYGDTAERVLARITDAAEVTLNERSATKGLGSDQVTRAA
ncbi:MULTISPECIES: hypothetical protein [Nocardioides]|uniref:Uncharacterized protein n=1 Tax=Nocardioides vastitatis TaxID=2568655 RepID=A0ABW0ZGM5_9ACTN|nr:hypothetical protein [Nocardioides sp.]THJ04339.1 hypothetical protein E7Z54_09005 [Nocardioides sp.]